ncbi:unnamed protein product [Leptidea sinapis]|uniref:Zinc finger CCCH domain-containing protein 14 n=1 Tax=Leptidea sinapis TaxID=189913 RepID=A0A5E4Q268_9NEOP|nr:unnamed protein product [Leptidea sinapis]
MDVIGSEIGQKMRSAIKAKLTELGCYVDDELPDYVMVMVANKRTQEQMEDDLQLFLSDNTELFVNWLHQVLKKLQEVTIAVPLKTDKDSQEGSVSKDKKSKGKIEKHKTKKDETSKKSKKKSKSHHKKHDKKSHKSKKEKKRKSSERIRPNIPPLLMNMEKVSEPSITDVFAGQILKNHGVLIECEEEKPDEIKPVKSVLTEVKRPIIPIIDPATINQPDQSVSNDVSSENKTSAPREDQLKEINEIEGKVQGLKQKLAEQVDSMSDDDDFLNIRTETEDLMNDFAEDVSEENSQTPTVATAVITPPIIDRVSPPSQTPAPKPPEPSNSKSKGTTTPTQEIPKDIVETLPQIELNLPKRPIRERLGFREISKMPPIAEDKDKHSLTPERLTPERDMNKSSRSRPVSQAESQKDVSGGSSDSNDSSKKVTSKVSSQENRSRGVCASVVRVRPRPRAPAVASNLLLRAVADAHKSLLNIPPKVDPEPHKVKRALVLPMRRTVDPEKIVIQVPGVSQSGASAEPETSQERLSHRLVRGKEEAHIPISRRLGHSDLLPIRTSSRRDDSLIIETINIHNTTVDKDKDTQFIVTMDGYHPNAFLAKKLLTEGLLDDDDEVKKPQEKIQPEDSVKNLETNDTKIEAEIIENKNNIVKDKPEGITENTNVVDIDMEDEDKVSLNTVENLDEMIKEPSATQQQQSVVEEIKNTPISSSITQKKRLSDTSEDSDTQVIIKSEEKQIEKVDSVEMVESEKEMEKPRSKKRKASPIVFDVKKKVETVRERTVSTSSDNHITLSTVTDTHKYDSVPPLSAASAERKQLWCRAFPLCRYGSGCVFQHPRCKFAASCTRRGCVYSHASPTVASHVVPVANFKSIASSITNVCKFFPNCVNPACHFYHPKPCRFGKLCANKIECNFYHNDVPAKWNNSL